MDYFDLLEQNTDDKDIQFELYKCCLNGSGRGNEEALEWLTLAAENGHEEAIKILDSRTLNIQEEIDEFENCSILELLDLSKNDYKAAKKVYSMLKKDGFNSSEDRIKMSNTICSFEEANSDDFDELIMAYLNSKNVKINEKDFFEACDNAHELGSKSAHKYYCNFLFRGTFPNKNDAENFNKKTIRYIKKGSYIDIFSYYCIIRAGLMNNCEDIYKYEFALRETLKEHPNSKDYPILNEILNTESMDLPTYQQRSYIEHHENNIDEQYSAAVFALALVNPNEARTLSVNYNELKDEFIFSVYLKSILRNDTTTIKNEPQSHYENDTIQTPMYEPLPHNANNLNNNNNKSNLKKYIDKEIINSIFNINKIKKPNFKKLKFKKINKQKVIAITVIVLLFLPTFLTSNTFKKIESTAHKESATVEYKNEVSNKKGKNLKAYIDTSLLEYSDNCYQGHATIESKPEDLVDWDSLAAFAETDKKTIKSYFTCSFINNKDNLTNGDIVELHINWDPQKLKADLGIKLKDNGDFQYDIKIKNLGEIPLFNLFKYVNVNFSGSDGKCFIELKADKKSHTIDDYTIQLGTYSGYGNYIVEPLLFAIYKNDSLLDNIVIYVNDSNLETRQTKNGEAYNLYSEQKIMLFATTLSKFNSDYSNGTYSSNIEYVEYKTYNVPKLNTLLTTQGKISSKSYNQIIKDAKAAFSNNGYTGIKFKEAKILEASGKEWDSAIVVFFEDRPYSFSDYICNYAYIIYDPTCDKNGLVEYHHYTIDYYTDDADELGYTRIENLKKIVKD